MVADAKAVPCVSDVQQEEEDASLERRIECARIAMTLATDDMSRRDHLERMTRLISQRSPEQRKRMEDRLPEPWRS